MRFLKTTILSLIAFLLCSYVFFEIVRDDWSHTSIITEPVNKDALLGELNENNQVKQDIYFGRQRINNIEVYINSQDSDFPNRFVTVYIEHDNAVLYEKTFDLSNFRGEGSIEIDLSQVDIPQDMSELVLCFKGNGGILLWYGNTRNAGKFDVAVDADGDLFYGDRMISGQLVMRISATRDLPYARYYWYFISAIAIIFVVFSVILYKHSLEKKDGVFVRLKNLVFRYCYLLRKLVQRDFKVRYKASVLGILWSFLNPLLMTFVYLFVFSTIFQSNIPYFIVYLMSGIVLFNYFSEATNLGMQSIIGNAGLITKVYIPKYIFPISKALSSAINMIISLIPLFIMMAITGVQFHKSMLLIPFVIVNIVTFCIGIGLILSAVAVFFRDIQFLWGIMLTVLNFLSPIFYPESIIPIRFIKVYHMNPMYQYLYFLRTITIGGISPTLPSYIYCLLASIVTLGVGTYVFRRMQDRFVLYL